MVLDFSPGVHSVDEYERRRDACTKEQLNRLFATPEFARWHRRARRAAAAAVLRDTIIRWDVVIGVGLVVSALWACLGLVLSPAVGSARPASADLAAAAFRTTAANHLSSNPMQIPLDARLEQPELARELHRIKEELDVALDRNSDLWVQLQEAQAKLEAAAAAQAVAAQAAAAQAAAAAAAALPAVAPAASVHAEAAPAAVSTPAAEAPVVAVQKTMPDKLAPDLPAPTHHTTYPNSTDATRLEHLFCKLEDKPVPVPAFKLSLPPVPASLVAGICASMLVLAYLLAQATSLHLRHKSEELEKQLQATVFAKETAEQSLELLVMELQRKVRQVESLQQSISAAASPLSITSDLTSPFVPAHYTPERGELPPPPAKLVEKFLKERHAVAVEEAQVQEWLLMEEEFARMRVELDSLAEQRCQLEARHQQLAEQSGQRSRDEHAQHLKEWLDIAQEELMDTQSRLQDRESECRRLTSQLAQLSAARAEAGEGASGIADEKEQDLLGQNLRLVEQLQQVTAACEALQAQLSTSQAELASKAAADWQHLTPRTATPDAVTPVAGTSALMHITPATQASDVAELSNEVDSIIALMRETRRTLASRLNSSQDMCGQAVDGMTKLARSSVSIIHSPPPNLSRSGSPEHSSITPMGSSNKLKPTNFSFTALPAPRSASRKPTPSNKHRVDKENSQSPAGGEKDESSNSLRKTREAAKQQVQSLRAEHSSWQVGEFLARVGCGQEVAAPTSAAEFETLKEQGMAALKHKATEGRTAQERALAGEAIGVLQEWRWPAQPIKVQPQSPPWFARIGLTR